MEFMKSNKLSHCLSVLVKHTKISSTLYLCQKKIWLVDGLLNIKGFKLFIKNFASSRPSGLSNLRCKVFHSIKDEDTCKKGRNKIKEILWEKYAVPQDIASAACSTFLKSFRKCPDNLTMDLKTWRHLLWSQALGHQYHICADEIYLKWLQLRYHYLALSPEILNLLSKLRQNYSLGLITNGPSRAQWEKVERLNLHSYFDIILVSGDLPWEKPNQQIFHKACRYLGVEPHQCLMVGDKLETDILGGIQANLGGTVWIKLTADNVPHNKFNPDYVLDNVTELLSLLPTTKIPAFERGREKNKCTLSLDLDDCSSNSSDGC